MATFTTITRSLTATGTLDAALTNPAFGDIDGDGLVDLVVGNTRADIRFFQNTGTATNPIFTEQAGAADPFDGITVDDAKTGGGTTQNGGFVSLVDIDGDSDLDLFYGGNYGGNVYFYENTDASTGKTTPTFAATATASTQDANTVFGVDIDSTDNANKYATPTFVDIDGDGDQDLFIGRYDAIDYYRNDGTNLAANFVKDDAANPLNGVSLTVTTGAPSAGASGPGGNRPNVAFTKLDGRTVFDAFIGNEDGTIRYFRNDGTTLIPTLTEVTGTDNPFNGYTAPDGEGRPALSFADIDNDGIVDAAIGSQGSRNFSDGAIQFFEEVPSTTTTTSSTTLANNSGGTFTFGSTSNGANLALQLSVNQASQITNVSLAFAGGATKSLFSVKPTSFSPTAFANDSSLTNRTFILQDTTFTAGQAFTLSFDLLGGGTVSSSQVTATETSSGIWTLGVDSDGNGSSDLTFSVFQTNNLADTNGIGTGTGTVTTQLNGGAEIFELAAATTGSFTLYREADFNNVVGLYQIDDTSGTVGGIAPGASGYAQAAINNRVSGADLQVGNQQSTTISGVGLTAGLFAPFIVVDGTVSEFLSGGKTAYFAYAAANEDGQDHILLLGNNLFGFEDLSGGGDFDYNDLIIQADFA